MVTVPGYVPIRDVIRYGAKEKPRGAGDARGLGNEGEASMQSQRTAAGDEVIEFSIPADQIGPYLNDWQTCAAFRFVREEDGTVRFQFALTDDTRDRYRQALVQIADAESGPWGRIAFEALHPERAR